MCKRLIFVMTFVFALGSTAHAALYLWNGAAWAVLPTQRCTFGTAARVTATGIRSSTGQ